MMKTKELIALSVLVLILALMGCQQQSKQASVLDMANPASVYCEENGGTLDMRTDDGGNQYGVCVFEDGSECEEWAYFNGECSPGVTTGEGEEPELVTGLANPASVFCGENGGVLDIRKSDDGGEYGVCLFADGSVCEEWAYFNGECAPETIIEGDPVMNWVGVIKANPDGAEFDDYFETADGQYGVGSVVEGVGAQLESLRDSGTTVHIWGVLREDVPDVNGKYIAVIKIETE